MLQKLDKLFLYAQMKRDEDNANHLYQGLADRAQNLGVRVSAALAFEAPELLSIDENKLECWLMRPELAVYQRFFCGAAAPKAHIRTNDEEEMLALAGEVCAAPRGIFGMFNNADLHFPTVRDETGALVEITHGNYTHLMESPSRQVREEPLRVYMPLTPPGKNSLAAMLAGSVKKDVFAAKVRRYDSALAAALFAEDIPPAVYDNLLAGVRAHLPLFYRYLQLRRQALGLDELHMYDIYTHRWPRNARGKSLIQRPASWFCKPCSRWRGICEHCQPRFQRGLGGCGRKSGQNQRGLLQRSLRHQAVYSAELAGQPEQRVHACPRAGPLYALLVFQHQATLYLRGLRDFCGGGGQHG